VRRAAEIADRFGLLIIWALVIVLFGILRPDTFLTTGNFQTIFGSQAALLVLSLGLLIPLTAGEFDLSIAGTLTFALVFTGFLNAEHGWPIGIVILIVLFCGALFGAINAFFVVVVGVESLIVTLGMGTLLTGAAFGISSGPVPGISDSLVEAVRSRWLLDLPLGFFYALALTAIVYYIYVWTPLGRYLFFVGNGPDVARLSGVRVNMIRAGSLVASGTIAALAALIVAGTLGSSSPSIGQSYLLPAFAAVFLGATTITPGRFNPWGTFVAVYFLITGITGLQALGLVSWIEQVFYGASLILAVALSRLAGRRRVNTS
jgi:ribose transport system permease protein